MADLEDLLRKMNEMRLYPIPRPIPPWDPILRFIWDYRDILTKEQQFKFAGLTARYQAEAMKIQKEYDAKMADLAVQASMDVQKTMGIAK